MEFDHSSVFSARGGGGSVADPDVFGPPGSGYISQRYGSGSFVEKTKFVIHSLQSMYGGDKSILEHHYNYISSALSSRKMFRFRRVLQFFDQNSRCGDLLRCRFRIRFDLGSRCRLWIIVTFLGNCLRYFFLLLLFLFSWGPVINYFLFMRKSF
jgi:hypothetical protein